jgi:hypothetical protein
MQSVIPGQGVSLPVIALIIAIIAIFLILIFLKMYQIKNTGRRNDTNTRKTTHREDSVTSPPDLPGKQIEKKLFSRPAEDISLQDQGDITKNLQALVVKYHIDGITLSTTDGLMIATTTSSGQKDAAQFSQALKLVDPPAEPGIKLFSIMHKGSSVIGIVRSDHQLADNSLKNIERDTEKIMNWWI